MKVIGDQGPRQAFHPGFLEDEIEPPEEVLAILVVDEDRSPLDAADHDVVGQAGMVDPVAPRHGWFRGTGYAREGIAVPRRDQRERGFSARDLEAPNRRIAGSVPAATRPYQTWQVEGWGQEKARWKAGSSARGPSMRKRGRARGSLRAMAAS